MPRAPTAVIEQMVADLNELAQNNHLYPTTAGIIRQDEWPTIRSTILLLNTVLARRALRIERSLNTDWAWEVKHESDMPAPKGAS